MKDTKKYLILFFCFEFLTSVMTSCRIAMVPILWVYNYYGDGLYSKSEPYVIAAKDNTTISLDSLLNLFYRFQMSHPDYRLMRKNDNGELFHDFHDKGGMYNYDHVYFYYKDIDITCACFLEMLKDSTILVYLNAVYDGVDFKECRQINEHRRASDERISRRENRRMKKKFETEILDGLGVKWKKFKQHKYNV